MLVQVDLLAEVACSGVPSTDSRSLHRHTLVLLAEVGGCHRVSAFLLLQRFSRTEMAIIVSIIIARECCSELLSQRQALKKTRSARGLQNHAFLGTCHSLRRLSAPFVGSQLAECTLLTFKAACLTRAR